MGKELDVDSTVKGKQVKVASVEMALKHVCQTLAGLPDGALQGPPTYTCHFHDINLFNHNLPSLSLPF